MAEATEVQEETARLESFWFSSAPDGSLERLHLVFHGLNGQGRNTAYTVNLGAGDELRWQAHPVEQAERYNIPPVSLMRALEEADVAKVADEREGVSLPADSTAGSVRYSSEYTDIFLLDDGRKRPIEEITFRRESPWLTMTVCPEPPEDEEADATETGSGPVVTETVRLEESDCEMWFLEQTRREQ